MIPLTAASSGFTFSTNWRGFELRQGNQIVATVRRPSIWSWDFLATTPSQSWIIRRGGFWGSKAEIIEEVSKQPVATFRSSWGGKGTLVFTDGQTFHSITRGFWHPVWTVITDNGLPVLQLHAHEKSVEIHSSVALPKERLLLLTLFTLYRVRQAEDAAAAAAVAAS